MAVELLDSYVCMRHSNQPDRLMALKIRLSRQLGYRVIQVMIYLLEKLLKPHVLISRSP